jgi:hypothetical protein
MLQGSVSSFVTVTFRLRCIGLCAGSAKIAVDLTDFSLVTMDARKLILGRRD